LERATGDYISFIDIDDDFELDMHSKIITKMLNEDADIGMCQYDNVDLNGKPVDFINGSNFEFDYLSQTELIRSNLLFRLNAAVWATLYKAELAKSIHFEENVKIGEDRLYQLRIALRSKKSIFLKENLYHYRHNSYSVIYSSSFFTKCIRSIKFTKLFN